MSRPHFVAGMAIVLVAGLGIDYGLTHSKTLATPPPRQPSPPPSGRTVAGKRALLVGVTRYANLRGADLTGPANDVRLMRRLLQQSYRFAAAAIVSLTEDEGRLDRRPTRANIAREFRRLADEARAGDQVVILLAGHGARQPADPGNREPDGIDEIFLPADVARWRGFPEKVPNAIVDKELARWLGAITTKKAHVWIIFDCCHSGTMTRGSEVVREVPPGLLVPAVELDRARARAARRRTTRGGPEAKSAAFVPRTPSDYLVAVYACREYETTPESLQPVKSPRAVCHGLLTYSLVDVLTKSAVSRAPLTYRELVRRLQVRHAARGEGAPTPLVEGRGQNQVVLGTEQPVRPRLLLRQDGAGYKIDAGDLHGLTTGSVLAVYSPAGRDAAPKLLGHVRVGTVQPFEATVESCAYEKAPVVKDFPPLSTCKPVAIQYGQQRFKVAVQVPEGQEAARRLLWKALEPLSDAKKGLVERVEDVRKAQWLVRLDRGKVHLLEASGNRTPFALPGVDSPNLTAELRHSLGRVFRARNLITIAKAFEEQRYRGGAAVDVEVEVLRHKDAKARGEVWPRPGGGWVFRPGDIISFRLKNRSRLGVDVTLLIVGSDFQIQPFYPQLAEGKLAKSVAPGGTVDTPLAEINNTTPFGPECLVVLAVPSRNPPADFSALAQEGLAQARSVDRSKSLQSPLGALLESAMFRSGARGLTLEFARPHGMRLLTWRTQSK